MTRYRQLIVGLIAVMVVTLASGLAAGQEEHPGYAGYFGTDYDFAGETVTFFTHGNGNVPGRFLEGGEAAGRIEEAEELFNVKLEFPPGVHYQEFATECITRLMAGESGYDIWLYPSNAIAYYELVSNWALLPIDLIVGDDYFDSLSPLGRTSCRTLDYRGRTYGFDAEAETHYPQDFPTINWNTFVFFYNKELFEDEGLDDPYDLFVEGEWTWEKAGELARQLTRDTDGDGEVDQWGISNIAWYWPIGPFILSNGTAPVVEDEEGNYVYNMDDIAVEDAIEQVLRWADEDRVMNGSRQEFVDGQLGLYMDLLWQSPGIMGQVDYTVGWVPIPKGPRADDYAYPLQQVRVAVLPANSEKPEALMALHEFLWRDYVDVAAERLMGWAQTCFPERRYGEMALNTAIEWDGEMILASNATPAISSAFQELYSSIMSGEKSYAQAVDEAEPKIQSMIDELLNR